MNRNCLNEGSKIIVFGELDKLKIITDKNVAQIQLIPSFYGDCQQTINRDRIKPLKMYSQGKILATIDQNEQAWLICQPFGSPINLSAFIKKKVTKIFIGEKQVILKTKKEHYLINWGSKKLINVDNLTKINSFPSSEYDSLFETFLINSIDQNDLFYYTPERKFDNSNRLYYLNIKKGVIIGYPTLDKFSVPTKIKGLSVGIYHSLCWDQQGILYSWGCKSLGLGYGELPSKEVIEYPQPVNTFKHIISAFAAQHYSLALTTQGQIYEWGIKKQVNQINRESIFYPRPLKFQYYKCQAHFISLKGRQNNYAVLSSQGQLYVWGANVKNMLNQKIILPNAWKGTYIHEPVLQTDLMNFKILDYSMQNSFISVVISNGSHQLGQEDYWYLLKQKTKKQLSESKMIGVSAENNRIKILKRKYNNSILSQGYNTTERVPHHTSKQIRNNIKTPETILQIPTVRLSKRSILQINNMGINCPKDYNLHKRQSSDQVFIHKKQLQTQLRHSELNQQKLSAFSLIKRRSERENNLFSKAYSIKLNQILQKKKKLETASIATNLKRIEQSSLEYKIKKKEFEDVKRRLDKDENILKSTVQKILIQSYIISTMSCSIDEGRSIKIHHLTRSFFLSRVQKIIQRLFLSAKVKFSLNKLRKQRLSRFFLLVVYFKRYVASFRIKKFESQRKKMISQITKREIMEKVKAGMQVFKQKNNKLIKLGKWMTYVKRQRKICLKQLWNNYIFTVFKFSDGYENSLALGDKNLTFSLLYKQKVNSHRTLQLKQFMRHSRKRQVFKISRSYKKKTFIEIKKQSPMKFLQQIRDRSGVTFEVLPFSSHYNYFHHPKSLQINIGEAFRSSSIWIQAQRLILEETLNKIIENYDKLYVFYMREYEVDLANFIKTRYETFCEKRWKYIIEYNKVERTYYKKKKEEELKRILSLVGMKRLVEEDCIPEKYLVLEEALQRKDAPKIPDPYLTFDFTTFQKVFRKYWENLNIRGKQLKKKLT